MEKIDTLSRYKEFLKSSDRCHKKVLIHACCAPCSSEVLDILLKKLDVTVYYYNPNTYPKDEYEKRFLQFSKIPYKFNIIKEKYDENEFYSKIKGMEEEKEGSKRCYNCYFLRLEKTAKYAKENGYDYFTTTLSISPYKNSKWINEICAYLSDKYKIDYIYSDFKKNEGYKKSIALSKEFSLYRQEYCGCKFSLEEAMKKELNKQKSLI